MAALSTPLIFVSSSSHHGSFSCAEVFCPFLPSPWMCWQTAVDLSLCSNSSGVTEQGARLKERVKTSQNESIQQTERERERDIDWCGMLSTEAGQAHVSHLLSGPLNSMEKRCYAVLTGCTGANQMSNLG